MKKLLKLFVKALFVSSILIFLLSNVALADDNTINMVVSPNVLNIESNGGSISVHTDIAYSGVEGASLEVNGTTIVNIETFADNCGNLVVKCSIGTVKSIVVGPDGIVVGKEEAEFILKANYNGSMYSGSDTITVIQVIPNEE